MSFKSAVQVAGAALGVGAIVGVFVAGNAMSHQRIEPQTRLVQPAAQTVPTPVPTVTVTAKAPVKVAAPKPVAKPVVHSKVTAPQTVKKAATVSDVQPTPDPTPTTDPAPPAPKAPPVKWGAGGRPTDQVGGVGINPPAGK